MNVLFLHPAGSFGGASKSLIELFERLKTYGVNGFVITPFGSSAAAFDKAGMVVIKTKGLSQFDNTKFGYYRGYRWLILLREFFLMPFSLMALIQAKNLNVNFDLLHINEITLLPLGVVAKWIFKLPLIVHVRSVQRGDCKDRRTMLVFWLLKKYADSVICIDETVKQSLPLGVSFSVIHNGINLDVDQSRAANKTQSNEVHIGIVGVLLRMKGIYEFIEAARILCLQRKLNIKFFVIGENARSIKGFRGWLLKKLKFSENVELDVLNFIKKNGLEENIELKGFISDVRNIYPDIDILCFPSHLNAVGRPVFEAAFYGIPSVVAVTNPMSDAIQHGITGLAIDSPDPVLLADALEKLIVDENYRNLLGQQAQKWAHQHFNIKKSALALFEIYKLLGSSYQSNTQQG